MSGGYKQLIVWQKAMDLVVHTYSLVQDFPKTEMFGLSSQITRSAVSIPSNIAEGSKRGTKADFRQFLRIALGSAAELETQIDIARRLDFGQKKHIIECEALLSEVIKMLSALVLKTHD